MAPPTPAQPPGDTARAGLRELMRRAVRGRLVLWLGLLAGMALVYRSVLQGGVMAGRDAFRIFIRNDFAKRINQCNRNCIQDRDCERNCHTKRIRQLDNNLCHDECYRIFVTLEVNRASAELQVRESQETNANDCAKYSSCDEN